MKDKKTLTERQIRRLKILMGIEKAEKKPDKIASGKRDANDKEST